HDLTTKRQQSIAAIDAYVASGGTALYDGLTDALMRLKRTEGRKVVVLLSDGRDEVNPGTGPGSARTQNDVFAALEDTDAVVCTILFDGPADAVGVLNSLVGDVVRGALQVVSAWLS